MALSISIDRLTARLKALAQLGAIEGDGVRRLALSDEDKAGRDLVVGWMKDLGLAVTVDAIGNIVGLRAGREDGPPVMTGSHLDTVREGGRYDGALGVLAGLEVVETLNAAGVTTRRPLAVVAFTNEEGSRFTPGLMGSQVFAGALDLDKALDAADADGVTVRDELARIGYAGTAAPMKARNFVELHIEQGPVLEAEGCAIGAVEVVQGISWAELTIVGQTNHAGSTPMALRHDAGFAATALAMFLRGLTQQLGGAQVATVGRLELSPGQINAIPGKAVMTIDLRNTDDALLRQAEALLLAFCDHIAKTEGVNILRRSLARFAPVPFDRAMVATVESAARKRGHKVRRMPSGGGHDAAMMAGVCPATMIFVPSSGGVSHSVREYTAPDELEAGANVLLDVLVELAG